MPILKEEMGNAIVTYMLLEKERGLVSSFYKNAQILFSFHSNRIEGSKITLLEARNYFESRLEIREERLDDDAREVMNHFKAFDYLLSIFEEPLNEAIIKRFHALIKQGTKSSEEKGFEPGTYKREENYIAMRMTTPPDEVEEAVDELLSRYGTLEHPSFEEVVDFHVQFERIHPFADGNGRVGRLILFKECLRFGYLPPLVLDMKKIFYYRGLKAYGQERTFLIETMKDAQDEFYRLVSYYDIPLEEDYSYEDLVALLERNLAEQ